MTSLANRTTVAAAFAQTGKPAPSLSARPRPGSLRTRRHATDRVGAAAGQQQQAETGSGGSSSGGGNDGVGPWHLRDDHLLPAHTGGDDALAAHGGTANGDGKLHHLPSSLYANFPKLPPDGSTLTPEEQKCDPEVERCRTPIHVWESRCTACDGTGTARSYTSHQRHRLVSVCLLCSGLGYVRHSSTHVDTVPYVNGSGPHTTIGRPPPADRKPPQRWPLPGGLHRPQRKKQ